MFKEASKDWYRIYWIGKLGYWVLWQFNLSENLHDYMSFATEYTSSLSALAQAGITDRETVSQSWLRYTGGEGLKGRNSLVWWEEENPLIKCVTVHDCNESRTYQDGREVPF